MRSFLRGAPVLVLGLAAAAPVLAQGTVHTPRVHALTNVTITQAPGRVIERGTVVIRDGLIEAVGASVAVPADARVWDLDSLHVYPGMIDLAMEIGVPESDEEDKLQDLGHELSVVHPEFTLADALPLKDGDRDARRSSGITTVRALPKGGAFRGRATVFNLGNGGLGENLLVRDAGQVMTFGQARGDTYPGSLMGSVAVIRQTLADARWYEDAMTRYRAKPRGTERPAANASLEALGPVMRGETAAIFVTDDVLDVLRAKSLGEEFGLRFAYVGSGEEYKRLDEIRGAIAGGLVVPVDFPEAPKVGEGGNALTVSLEKLRRWDNAPSNPAKVHGAGVEIAFTATGLKDVSSFRENVGKAIEAGLPADAALAACTTVPARMAGLADQAGTIDRGMLANLVVTDGDLFGDSKVREVWVDGERYEVEKVEPPKGDPRGTWSTLATTPDGQTFPGEIVIGGEIGSLTAALTLGNQAVDANITQSGSTVTIWFDGTSFGMPGVIRYSVALSGDTADGSGNSPFGSFSMSMTRTAPHPSGSTEGGAR